MLRDWTFGKKIGLGFFVAGLTLVAIAFSGYESTRRLIENEGWVSHTQEVRSNLAQLLRLAVDAESGQRGFVVTGTEAFLDSYRASIDGVDKTFDELRHLTSDNPEQQRRLDALRPVLDEKLTTLRAGIDLRRNSGFDAAQRLVATGEGRRAMDDLRRFVGEMDRTERDLLERRREEAESSARGAKAVILWGSIAGCVFVALVGLFISRSLGAQISAAVRHIQSSSTELQSASNQQATGARQQATAMNEIATTISELMATSRQIAESAQRVAMVAERTAQAARAGDTTVARGSDTILGIRKQVDLIVSHMLELGKKSQQIGSVLDIVAELAEQTNILAINATIEAAGAGDAGKRFAVVADEIRKLADRVGGSTKEIRALIDDVRAAVNLTVMTTETGSKAVDGGAKQFAEVATSFTQIATQVGTTTEAAREIELSTKQQSTAVEQVNIAITNVAQAAKESEVSTRQTLQTASELAGLSRELIRIVQPQETAMARATP